MFHRVWCGSRRRCENDGSEWLFRQMVRMCGNMRQRQDDFETIALQVAIETGLVAEWSV